MRSFGMLAGGLIATLMAGAAPAADTSPPAALAGAPSAGAPMQPGAWGQGGWQAGSHAATPMAPQGWHGDRRGGWNHGGGHRDRRDYRRASRGWQLPQVWLDPTYTVGDWNAWGLGQPGPGMRWVRYYDDAVLVDGYGRVVDVRDDFDWERGRGGYAGGPGGYPQPGFGPAPYGPAPYGYNGGQPGVTTYRAGPNTTVTTAVIQAPPVIAGGPAYGYGYGGGYYAGAGSIVTVTPGTVVTTTTTTTDYETSYRAVAVRAKRVWRRPARRPSHRRCVQTPTCPVLGS